MGMGIDLFRCKDPIYQISSLYVIWLDLETLSKLTKNIKEASDKQHEQYLNAGSFGFILKSQPF